MRIPDACCQTDGRNRRRAAIFPIGAKTKEYKSLMDNQMGDPQERCYNREKQ
jgi:hypothetical protein